MNLLYMPVLIGSLSAVHARQGRRRQVNLVGKLLRELPAAESGRLEASAVHSLSYARSLRFDSELPALFVISKWQRLLMGWVAVFTGLLLPLTCRCGLLVHHVTCPCRSLCETSIAMS